MLAATRSRYIDCSSAVGVTELKKRLPNVGIAFRKLFGAVSKTRAPGGGVGLSPGVAFTKWLPLITYAMSSIFPAIVSGGTAAIAFAGLVTNALMLARRLPLPARSSDSENA